MIDRTSHIEELFERQLRSWELALSNYLQLDEARTREIVFDNFSVFVQYNPGRIRSSAANVDQKSIAERPCFLCSANRPSMQEEVAAGNDFIFLINPYPIFRKHLTIPSVRHTPQRISGHFDDLLELSVALPGYVFFYNGPECGASAPDHLHFQAGNRNFLPVEKDFENQNNIIQVRSGSLNIWKWQNYLRGIITISSFIQAEVSAYFEDLMQRFSKLQTGKIEPMINILVYYSGNKWIVHLIPRKAHRPAQYFTGNEEKLVVSPASVDLGGVIITPREVDFERLNNDIVRDIFSQVCYTDKEIEQLIN